MGLDSIELLIEIEKYFGIQIPDAEAEKIYTVQLMVDVVAKHLGMINESSSLENEVLQKLNSSLLKNGLIQENLQLSDLLNKAISPADKMIWKIVEDDLQLSIPKPDFISKETPGFFDKVRTFVNWQPSYDLEKISIGEFVAAICAANQTKLIAPKNIISKYEIYIIVMALTVDKIGVDYYEVKPEKSFTNDLGVD